jgi:predicted aspartyl protease
MPSSFTCKAKRLANVLTTPVRVIQAFDSTGKNPAQFKEYKGIWDTGATGTVITQKVIDDCGLKPISMTKAHGADGEYDTEVYLIDLHVPNGVLFNSLRVTKGKLKGVDLLIGMDIIGKGDFAVTNHNGITCFSFRMPSSECIDFVKPKPVHTPPRQGRNEMCACGSGVKFKRCCGKV